MLAFILLVMGRDSDISLPVHTQTHTLTQPRFSCHLRGIRCYCFLTYGPHSFNFYLCHGFLFCTPPRYSLLLRLQLTTFLGYLSPLYFAQFFFIFYSHCNFFLLLKIFSTNYITPFFTNQNNISINILHLNVTKKF